ncbi:dynamin family protein [Planococcus sp. X10-3]|uniref:dynamin family protein n=1 Tax=Planococcus sp. X10-3 TaxID=3061240 RepID=UPI003BB0DA24
MMKINMTYNPYKVETTLWIADENFMETTKFEKFKHDRLQVWIENLFPMLVEELNEDSFEIYFTGTLPDFEDLQEVKNGYHGISLTHVPVEEAEDKFTELEELVQIMKDGPFEQLKDSRIEANFQRALNSEFEIAVIATMSSGKSTLINALLGKELMPSKNEACTAKVSRIKNNPSIKNFSAIAYDQNGEIFKTIANASVEHFTEFNDDPEIHLIEIEGNIPKIKPGKMNLVLVDTPGPNNSIDETHRQHTLSVIKSDDKPMILYVLNATQLRTDDDLALLRTVADSMAVGGKQSKDRFIFAMNKSDEFDPEKGESIGGAIDSVSEYLDQQGIENPNIYPVSAQVAKVIRKSQSGLTLTRSEKADYYGKELFIEEESMHLQQYAPLSPSLKKSIEQAIQNAKDDDEKAVHYSGITSIEAAINEYLEKYAITSKITNAVNSFQRIVEKEDMQNKLEQVILEDSGQRKIIAEVMWKISEELESGEKAKNFKEKIQGMDLKVDTFFAPTNRKMIKQLQDATKTLRVEKMKKVEVEHLMLSVEKNIRTLQNDLLTDIEVEIREVLRSTAEGYVNEYSAYIKDITDFQTSSISLKNWDKALIADVSNAEELLVRFSFSEDVIVETSKVKNTSRKWFMFWKPKTIVTHKYEEVEYVNMESLAEEFILPIESEMSENIEKAKQFTKEELHRLQKFFITEIERLEKLLKQRVVEINELALQSEYLETQLKEHTQKKEWLEKFTEKLNSILELKVKEGIQL